MHDTVVGSVEEAPGTFSFNGPSTSTGKRSLNAASMLSKLQDEFGDVRKYRMVEPPVNNTELNSRWNELEDLCEKDKTAKGEPSLYPLYNASQYYQLNRLTLWVSKNKHKYKDKHENMDFPFPRGYVKGMR